MTVSLPLTRGFIDISLQLKDFAWVAKPHLKLTISQNGALGAFEKASQYFFFAVFDDLVYFTADVLFNRWRCVRREYFANFSLCSFDW